MSIYCLKYQSNLANVVKSGLIEVIYQYLRQLLLATFDCRDSIVIAIASNKSQRTMMMMGMVSWTETKTMTEMGS